MKAYHLRTGERFECDCPPHMRHDHGTRRMYQVHRCGCFPCRLANHHSLIGYKAGKSNVERMVDPTGTVRRLQALSAIGISRSEIAEHLGVTERAVQYLRNTKAPVQIGTARRVAALYDLLWDAKRTGRGASVARTRAQQAGWLPPMAWINIDDPNENPLADLPKDDDVDEIAVERIMGGTLIVPPGTRKHPDLVEAIRRLAARGMTDTEIGHRVHRSPDVVLKIRERNDIPAGVECPRQLRPATREDTAA